jgi:dynein intermediate chain 2
MTVGDWSVRLWAEELKTPIFQTCPPTANSSAYLTSGGWSCSRPGVFFVSRFDGVVDFYDYHYQMNQVAYSHKVGDIPLSCVINSNSGRLVAVGDSAGTVTLVELCEELCQGSSVEKTAVGSLLDREQRRERNLDSLKKQQKVFSPLEDVNKSIYTNKTINQHEYVEREKEWLENVALIDRSWDLTVKAGL